MLKKRIIPCLDIQNGRTVKGTNFVNIRDAGCPIELAKTYVEQTADELVFLDITATIENRKTLRELVKDIAKEINIPFTVGGGVEHISDVEKLLNNGAEKVSINSKAVKNPLMIDELAKEFGTQCIVLAVDTNRVNNEWMVFVHGGRTQTDKKTLDWVSEAADRGAGEILLTSMEGDGTKNGYSIDITRLVNEKVNIPVIASGGAGNISHFIEVFEKTKVDAALAASVFHFGELAIPELKNKLREQHIPVR